MVESIEKIAEYLSKDPILEKRNKLGLCRMWTDRALNLVEGLRVEEQELVAEAREVQVEQGLFHTFVRIKVGEKSYLWDGVGTSKHDPYFGPEDQAPEYLKNSNLDMISVIRSSG